MPILPRRWRLPWLHFLVTTKEKRVRPVLRSIKRVSRRLRGKHTPNYILRRRIALGEALARRFERTVRYGPFRGLKLADKAWWGADTSSMLLGLYEQEVLASLAEVPKTHRIFIDLGAANGYYGVGVLVGGLADFAYCFERSMTGRRLILENARLNGVEGRLKLLGHADRTFFNQIPAEERARAVLFVDIEGGELDLLDDAVLEAFRGAVIFVELHEWFYADGAARLEALRKRAERRFRITELTTAARDLSGIPELDEASDDDRWIVCSEGRGRRMRWWRLDPVEKAGAASQV